VANGPKGRTSSLATLGLLTALAVGGLAFSVCTAPSVPDYGSLPETNASATAALDQAVDTTLAGRSFTAEVVSVAGWFGQAGYHYSVDYHAPDSLEIYPTHLLLAVSGSGATFIQTPGDNGLWSETCPNPFESGAQPATQFLSLLLGPVSVQGSGNRFTTESIGGSVLGQRQRSRLDITTTIADGRIGSEEVTTVGPPTNELRITYSAYDSSPDFALPRPAKNGAGCRRTGWVAYSPSNS
jgi:hypothetical protein